MVDSLWEVDACIPPWSEARLLCLLRVDCFCIGAWQQLWLRGHWVEEVEIPQWCWENVLCLWCVMTGCWLGTGQNGWCRQRDGQLDHHTQKQSGTEGNLACEFWVAHRREVYEYFWEEVKIISCFVNYVLGVHVFYESACIIDYCICSVVGDWFVCYSLVSVRGS